MSVIVPVKNEEKNLGNCLSRLDAFAEVLVVDSGSTDKTVQIAKDHGATVIDFKWNGKFPKKRNWALRNCEIKNDWVLFLDADESVTPEFTAELSQRIGNESVVGYLAFYRNHFMGKSLRFGDRMRKLPLFKVGCGEYERIDEDAWSNLDMEVHEHPVLNGPVGKLRSPIIHNDFKGLDSYRTRHDAYADWEEKRYLSLKKTSFTGMSLRQRLKYRLMNTWLLGPLYFLGAYVFKLGFLDGKAGLTLALFKARYFLNIKRKIDRLTYPEINQS